MGSKAIYEIALTLIAVDGGGVKDKAPVVEGELGHNTIVIHVSSRD